MDPQLRKLVLWTLAALLFTIVVGLIATWLAVRSFGQP
jgi:hypothetical protein